MTLCYSYRTQGQCALTRQVPGAHASRLPVAASPTVRRLVSMFTRAMLRRSACMDQNGSLHPLTDGTHRHAHPRASHAVRAFRGWRGVRLPAHPSTPRDVASHRLPEPYPSPSYRRHVRNASCAIHMIVVRVVWLSCSARRPRRPRPRPASSWRRRPHRLARVGQSGHARRRRASASGAPGPV